MNKFMTFIFVILFFVFLASSMQLWSATSLIMAGIYTLNGAIADLARAYRSEP